jgi:hypothetical protein
VNLPKTKNYTHHPKKDRDCRKHCGYPNLWVIVYNIPAKLPQEGATSNLNLNGLTSFDAQ